MSFAVTTAAQLGSTLRGLRKSLRLTQMDVAQKSGLQQKTISLLETAPQRCSVDSLMRYLGVMQVVMTLGSDLKVRSPDAGYHW